MEIIRIVITCFILVFLLSFESNCVQKETIKKKSLFENFITVSGNKLMEGESEFRFISFNIPNLNFVEDEMAFTRKHAFGLPSSFEIRDALESVKQMGGRVVRLYTIPVRRETDIEDVPRYVLGPGEFDERSFTVMDTVLAIANEVEIRLIIPLVNHAKWMGGAPQYAGFRSKATEDFWNDPQLISDFKETVKHVLTRTNTITGTKYKDDKAILCWETGNELRCPHSWTVEIVKYIKSLDSNHLVMDGYFATWRTPVREESVLDPNIDIVSSHHYEPNPDDMIKNISANLEVIKGRKPYIIGEFGFIGTPGVKAVLNKIIKEDDIAGALIWSLRYHRKEGGFYWHSEPLGGGLYKAYHWPGFPSGEEYDERDLLGLMRQKAFEIQGKEIPKIKAPDSPVLLPFNDVSQISWQGSVGASFYDVERATSKGGPWKIVGYNVTDAEIQYYPLFNDKSAEIGKEYYYRIVAENAAGISLPSNIVGPVKVNHKVLIDNMNNYGTLYSYKGEISHATGEDKKFKEDTYRMKGEVGSELIYLLPGKIKSWRVYSFSEENEKTFEFFQSVDGKDFVKIIVEKEDFFGGEGDYNYWHPILYTYQSKDKKAQYLKIKFTKTSQIGRVEISYSH